MEQKVESHRFSRYYTALEPFLARPEIHAYTMFILSFLAMSFFGYFAIRPTLITISTLRRQIADARFVDQKLQEKINALSSISLEYEQIKPDLGLVWAALPQETKFPVFVKDLEKIATESGATINAITFEPVNLLSLEEEATVSAREIPIGFSITLEGNYTNLADFIEHLSYFERMIIIDKLEIADKGEKEGVHLTLQGKTFYVK